MGDTTTSETTLRSLSLGPSRREETLLATWGDVSTHLSKSKGLTSCIFFFGPFHFLNILSPREIHNYQNFYLNF